MNAFMYYIRRIDLLAAFAVRDNDGFTEYALEELREDIQKAASQMIISSFQENKLLMRLESQVV